MAGKITYLAPIDNASGKIFGKKERFTAVTRSYGKYRRGCTATGKRDLVNHPYTELEQAQKEKFAAIAKAVLQRMANPAQIAQDQQAFREQTEYDTLRKYLWHLCAEEYDQQNA